jgi:hypothetical protein
MSYSPCLYGGWLLFSDNYANMNLNAQGEDNLRLSLALEDHSNTRTTFPVVLPV